MTNFSASRGDRPSESPPDDDHRFVALADLSEQLADAITDTASLLSRLVELVSKSLGDAVVLHLVDGGDEKMAVAGVYDSDRSTLEVMRDAFASTSPATVRLLPNTIAIREGRPVLLTGRRLDEAISAMPSGAADALKRLEVHSALICPLRVHGHNIGTLDIWRRGDREPHSERDQNFAQQLADRSALAIENARLVEHLRTEVEERTRNEDKLRVAAEMLQVADEKRKALVEHLVAAQEEERRRIAIDVHDDSIQAMAAIGLRLQILRRHAPDRAFATRVAEIEDTVTDTIGRLRSLLFRLESASLEKEGLAHAIGRCMADLFPDGAPRGRVVNRLKNEPPGYVQVVLFRIAQEALTNVRKHARASEVSVVLDQDDQGTLLVVQDDGLGFDPDELVRHALPGHLGMRGMEQRAQVASGWLKVESKPGKGTTLSCWLPPMETVQTGREPALPRSRLASQSGPEIIPSRSAAATASSLE